MYLVSLYLWRVRAKVGVSLEVKVGVRARGGGKVLMPFSVPS